ncbi:MAG: hypothetical protein N3G21_06190 [Candidatus Hydrogenedentes bacterium]|nr:hypothetical protein [Candidatus Hydrogenedentota bacterium]
MSLNELYVLIYEHIERNSVAYGVGVVLLIPFLYLTRKWSLPFLFYAIESLIYITFMHIFMFGFVKLVVWFYVNTQMRALRPDGTPAYVPDWQTPLVDFWNRNGYIPEWLFYLEIVFALVIILLVWRYRPPKLGPVKRRRRRVSEEYEGLAKEEQEKRKKYLEDILP